ncbi:hypothetical protein [Streptomyces sp. H39-S7]|uniref:hypothetical protein n=1 Tax=Streptomyces sp. H39-S7 TaxID=3004357 RepID=UPI0022B07604|nr:hypothetical protein [Streptomyces sp. H39-S7]MCZ4122867.1 hypothetical protein [Streptomyces sp. H39-S7]
MPAKPVPEFTKLAVASRLRDHAATRWPQLTDLTVRWRGQFVYAAATLPGEDEPAPLFRLRYLGTPDLWDFAIHLGSSNAYEDSLLPSGSPEGTPEEALDCACGLYLSDPSAWLQPPQQD